MIRVTRPPRIRCCVCGKQAVSYWVGPCDKQITILEGAKAGFGQHEVFCGYCAQDLDPNGLLPDEPGYSGRSRGRWS